MPTIDQVIDEPQTLKGLFPPDSDDEDEDATDTGGTNDEHHNQPCCFEVQSLTLTGCTFRVRQFDYHSHNANRVWPGTFNLSDYLLEQVLPAVTDDHSSDEVKEMQRHRTTTAPIQYKHQWGRILELGTATGLLAMRLALVSTMHHTRRRTDDDDDDDDEAGVPPVDPPCRSFCCTTIVTSDVQDEQDDIRANLRYNYTLNEFRDPPLHVPHTWGTGWTTSVQAVLGSGVEESNTSHCGRDNPSTVWNPETMCAAPFDTIVASDILLYVSAYPALVKTLTELFALSSSSAMAFVMSWNRRMKESNEFFALMEHAGFTWTHEGKCIYTFRLGTTGMCESTCPVIATTDDQVN